MQERKFLKPKCYFSFEFEDLIISSGRKYFESSYKSLLTFIIFLLSTESGAAVCEFFLKAACGKGKLYFQYTYTHVAGRRIRFASAMIIMGFIKLRAEEEDKNEGYWVNSTNRVGFAVDVTAIISVGCGCWD